MQQRQPNDDALYNLVERQYGYFTAAQAKGCGFSQQLQSYHTTAGHWLRRGRGIFRLKHFPAPIAQEDLYVTYLWTSNRKGQPEGVFTHGTAFYLHQVSTYVPPVLDITVPPTFRRYSTPPRRICLYKRILKDSDCEMMQGLKVTRLLQTILDLLEDKVIDGDYVLDGLRRGLETLKIIHPQLKSKDLTAAQHELLLEALEKIGYARIDEIR
jgi:hypothetical protein